MDALFTWTSRHHLLPALTVGGALQDFWTHPALFCFWKVWTDLASHLSPAPSFSKCRLLSALFGSRPKPSCLLEQRSLLPTYLTLHVWFSSMQVHFLIAQWRPEPPQTISSGTGEAQKPGLPIRISPSQSSGTHFKSIATYLSRGWAQYHAESFPQSLSWDPH